MTMSEAPRDATPAPITVRPVVAEQLADAADLLARGFAEEPGNVALLPDPEARHRLMAAGARSVLRRTIPHGTVHAATVGDELAAIAIWEAPGVPAWTIRGAIGAVSSKLGQAPTLVRALPHKLSVIAGSMRPAVGLVRARQRAIETASTGLTWHLAFLATAPEHRGRGLARQLLERQLSRCDEDGAAAWLETTEPVNPPIYERFGFTTVARVEDAAWLPGLWVMRREPGGVP
jgi:GNAT superfamily N-acetyltransferase